MFILYNLIYFIGFLIIFPFDYFKRNKEYRNRWLHEKFGKVSIPDNNLNAQPIWVHAVSVGEVIAAVPLLKSIREKYPSRSIVLSTITDTGQKVALEKVPKGISVIYLPYDIPNILRRAVKRVNPQLLIIIETEFWPNLFKVFKKNGIPIILLNGRISNRSFRGYRKISFFMKQVLRYIDFLGMQGETDAERIQHIGADKNKIKVLGNFKFDIAPPTQLPSWTKRINKPALIAGSTFAGEEELLVEVYLRLKKEFPELNFIIAPRHPQRFAEVEDMLQKKGVEYFKRSTISDSPLSSAANTEHISGKVIFLDTVGELAATYGIADISIIGKSFKETGGQNPFEPAAWGKPIICGPHMENFPAIQEFYQSGAAIQVSESELYPTLKDLLSSPDKAQRIGMKAQELYQKNAGAVDRAMTIIAQFIPRNI